MKQHEILEPLELLDDKGFLVEEGWARRPFWRYDRSKVGASAWRIKEWDYYYILSHEGSFGITCTVSDLGYIGLVAAAWLDLSNGRFAQCDEMGFFPMGKTGLPRGSEEGGFSYRGKKLGIQVSAGGGLRRIRLEVPGFKAPDGSTGLTADLELADDPGADSMNIATSWKENRKAFYYNRKINCMPARGKAVLGGREFSFSPSGSSGGLDWGRGVWTYKNRWYWGSASGYLDGIPFGWNIGYGFSDRSPASENVIFYDGRAHKFDEVEFHIDTNNYLAPWTFTSSDGRFEMEFEPAVDRSGSTSLLLIKSIQHQVFGYFTGKVVLDDGRILEVRRFLGFAEDVLNWW